MQLKKAALTLFGMVLAAPLMAPAPAAAQVNIGVTIGEPVVVRPAPVVVQPAPVVVQPAPVVVYDDAYIASHAWTFGFHAGWYYDSGARYWVDARGHRHYDHRYARARRAWHKRHHHYRSHRHRDNGRWHKGGHRDRGRDFEAESRGRRHRR
jgi:hypothetical protein